jgi:uncharacterized protein (DUF1697 family)
MTHFFTFLRAINVTGRNVKMDHLKGIFESLGFSNVETFIASGNVIFDKKPGSIPVLEKKIEKKLNEVLGYEVATFIRTSEELSEIAQYQPFPPSKVDSAAAFNIFFLANALDDLQQQKLKRLQTEIDELHFQGREIYWLCRKKQSESKISNAVIEKKLELNATLRGINTVRKMVEKYC